MIVGRIEFWASGGLRLRIVKEAEAPIKQVRGMKSITDLVISGLLALERTQDNLKPEFDISVLHKRNADLILRRVRCN